MLVRFTKMHGLGNDFMVVDGLTQKVFFSKELIKKLSDRHFGIGFDQLLILEPPFDPEVDFHYRVFNADGNEIEVGANGARCLMRFILDHHLSHKRELRVSTMSGVLKLKFNHDESVTVNMGLPLFEPEQIPLRTKERELLYKITLEDGTELSHTALSLGNPHAIFFVDDPELALAKYGKELESHHNFPEHMNIGFAKVIADDRLILRCYERGCGETLACGSNACAAVVSAFLLDKVKSNVTVSMKGGELKISYGGTNRPIMMTGPATRVFEGTIVI